MNDSPINLAVLISGGGTTLQNLIDQIAAGALKARIVTVIVSRSGIGGIERAKLAGLPVHVVSRKEFLTIDAFSDQIFSICRDAGVDLICLGGWLQLLRIPDEWLGRVINIHPSLLPQFGGKGMFGHHVHEAVLKAGCAISGCTVHFVNNEYDAGPVILQRECGVYVGDTPETLAARVFEEEKAAYPAAIELWRLGQIRLVGNRVETR
ncbi:MAG: phosphoribosylglycinamide formyltransferase [Burkholderiales bacterium]|nr:phosphoribosylglycinamide formyltransferase [Phycisphaerae bacterium]